MAAIIVPVGFDNGPSYNPDAAPGTGPEFYEIVKRVDIVKLPLDAYEVWQSAHLDVALHSRGEFSRDHLVQLAAKPERDAAGTVSRLLASELLIEYEIGTASAIKLLQGHRLYPTGDGLGNSEEHPELFGIGRGGDALLEVINEVYTFWSLSYAYPSIWDAVVEDAKEIPPGVPYGSAEELGQLLAAAIPMIVATHTGVLQPI